MSTMTVTGKTGSDPKEPSVVIHTTHVRFAIAQKDASNTVPIPSIMHKIMNKIRDHDNKTIKLLQSYF
jgi:S-ribosylhomocysteine lyase LuxS involved in autoinducer biosynthesis